MIKEFVKRFNETKYSRWYFAIIKRALNQQRSKGGQVYYERHHIVPKSIDPTLVDLNANPHNGVLLTAREHILCHWLLCYMTEGRDKRSAMRAFHAMCFKDNGGRNKRSPNVAILAIAREMGSHANRGKRGCKGVPKWFGSESFDSFNSTMRDLVLNQQMSDPQIGAKYGVSAATIHNWKRKLGIPNRRNQIRDPKWLREMYQVNKLSAGKIAEIAGCTGAAIQQKLIQYGIPIRDTVSRQHYRDIVHITT